MSDSDRLVRVLDALASAPEGTVIERLCSGAAKLLDAPGVGVSVATGASELQTVCVTDAGGPFDRLQSSLGEGPALTAHGNGWPVIVADLAHDDTWPAFGPAASDLGLGAAFAFPMRRGSARIGALTLYRQVAGEPSDEQHADAVTVARVALGLVLASQSGRSGEDLDEMFHAGGYDGAAIHQASGMVSIQLGIDVANALAVLRAHAFAASRPLPEVAADVLGRRLRMNDHEIRDP